MQRNIRLDLSPSLHLALIFILIHMIAIASLFLITVPFIFKLMLICVLILMMTYHICHSAMRCTPHAIINLKQVEALSWLIQQRNGKTFKAELCLDSYLSNCLILLNFSVSGKKFKRSVILLSDGLKEDNLLPLRAYIRFASQESGQ